MAKYGIEEITKINTELKQTIAMLKAQLESNHKTIADLLAVIASLRLQLHNGININPMHKDQPLFYSFETYVEGLVDIKYGPTEE